MRIAVFTDTYYPQVNGVSVILKKMKDYMDAQGIQYVYFVPGHIEEPGVFACGGRNFPLYPELLVTMPRHRMVADVLDRFQPDLIHVATEFALGWQGIRYARRHQLPVSSTYHTNFVQYLKYYKLGFLEEPGWKYLRSFHNRCGLNFVPSLSTLRLLEEHGIPRLQHCPHGIDSHLFSPAYHSGTLREQYLPDGDGVLLLYVGRMAPEKDLEVLLEAARILNGRGLAYRLLMVGDGPSRVKLEAMQVENVVFCGYRRGQELYEMYASADIFVFPSVTETFGNVILEAMASGLPVVAAPAGGVEDNLLHQVNGLAFRAGDPLHMAEQMQAVIENDTLRHNLADQALLYARSRTWNQIFAEMFTNLQTVKGV